MANLKQQFTDYDNEVEKSKPQYSALLGKTQNVVQHPTRNGFCYARMADNLNELIVVFNDKVSQVYNLPILVERRGNNWYVVGRDTQRYSDWGSSTSYLPKHAKQHEFNRDEGTGADAVFIYPDQLTPLLVYPSGSSGINSNLMVAPYMLQRSGDFAYVGGTGTQNILMYKPLDDQAILGLVYLDKVTGNPGFIIASGTTFDGSYTGTSQIAPYLPYPENTNQEPLYFVRLTSGTSSLEWGNLYNARQFIGGMGSSTTGSSGSVPTFITGSIPFSGADGILTENNSELFWSDTYKALWLGKWAIPFLQSVAFPFVVTSPAENQGVAYGGLVYGTGTNGSPSMSWNAYRSRGTYENPTPVQNGDALGTLIGAGYGGAGWINATRERFYANADWVTGSNYESKIEWEVTPSGSVTRRVGMTLCGDSLNLPTGTYNIGGVPHTHAPDVVTIADVLLASDVASFDFTSIPATYKHLEIRYYMRSAYNGTGEGIKVIFNNDSGANYDYGIWYDTSSSSRGTIPAVNQTAMIPTYINANTAPANMFAHGTIWINNYTETTGYKTLQVRGIGAVGATVNDMYLFDGCGTWKSTSPISRITVTSQNGANFKAGSRMTLIGYK